MKSSDMIIHFKKEIWEFKKTLFWVPLILAVFIIAAPLFKLMLLEDYQAARLFDVLTNVDNLDNIKGFAKLFLATILGTFIPFVLVGLIIQLYYFTTCLFDERRDLSIYFWRSLPVHDGLSVAVKLLTGAFVLPAIFMLAATAVLLAFLLLAFIACIVLSVGYDISLWGLWSHANIFSNLGAVWLSIFPFALWMLPLFAWLMLASVYASKAPFLWAVLPIAAVLLIESFTVQYFGLESRFFFDLLREYFEFGHNAVPANIDSLESPNLILLSALFSKVSIVGTIISIAFVYLTYWLRVNKSHL